MSGGPGPAIEPYQAEIVSNERPFLFIGADPGPAPRPVIGSAELRTWSIYPIIMGEDAGKYTFVLDGQNAAADEDRVVTITGGAPKAWDVEWDENEPASFSVFNPGTGKAWTLTPMPGGHIVTLEQFRRGQIYQLFSLSFKE